MKKVLLGFSGGIDSTASAITLKNQGYKVSLLTLNTCNDSATLDAAVRAADELNMELNIVDITAEFKAQVIDYFCDSYLSGETPAPCTVCNRYIKWRILYETAAKNGFDHIATGHYFRVTEINGIYYVVKGVDPVKDQSYYLWDLPQEYLKMIVTPMGDQIKSNISDQIRKKAAPRESMGVCFLKGGGYADFIKARLPEQKRIAHGDVVDSQGVVVGDHDGYPYYTIGQKRDFRIAEHVKALKPNQKWCVIGIDAKRNQLVAGDDTMLYHRELTLKDYRLPNSEYLNTENRIAVKVRGLGRNPDGFCSIRVDGDRLHVTLAEPAWASAKGQPVVLYDGDLVIGGGFLESFSV